MGTPVQESLNGFQAEDAGDIACVFTMNNHRGNHQNAWMFNAESSCNDFREHRRQRLFQSRDKRVVRDSFADIVPIFFVEHWIADRESGISVMQTDAEKIGIRFRGEFQVGLHFDQGPGRSQICQAVNGGFLKCRPIVKIFIRDLNIFNQQRSDLMVRFPVIAFTVNDQDSQRRKQDEKGKQVVEYLAG